MPSAAFSGQTTNPQTSLASVAKPEASHSAFRLHIKGGSKLLNAIPRSTERTAKLVSNSAVPELSRVNSDVPKTMKFPIASHAPNYNRTAYTFKPKDQSAGSKDVSKVLQENIETIKNLKDDLTIEQLQLIQSICQGKLE
jgi:hypothetical protein